MFDDKSCAPFIAHRGLTTVLSYQCPSCFILDAFILDVKSFVFVESTNVTVVALIAVVAITIFMLITAAAAYVARKYLAGRRLEQQTKHRETKVEDSSTAQHSKHAVEAEKGLDRPNLKKKRRKTTQRSSSKIISGADEKRRSGSKLTPQ